MDERTDDELEMVFELGCIKGSLKQSKLIKQLRRDDYKNDYFLFKTLASKLGIDLTDQSPEETTAEDEVDKFYSNQVTHVQNYLLEHKTNYVQKIFSIGDHVEQLLIILSICNEVFSKNESLPHQNVQRLAKLVRKLQILAKSLGIDISEVLSKVNDHEKLDEDDINILKLELKTTLCKRANEPTQMVVNTKRSEVDLTRMITDDYWAISLVRLPDASHKQHAFLVLQGMTGNKSMIWFVDFVANDTFDLLLPGMRDGRVRMDDYKAEEVVGSSPSGKLLFQCRTRLMKIRKGNRWLHQTWHITKGTAQNLIQCIDGWRKKPPKYNILGDSKLAASSATLSNNSTGHNCFTFARMILLDLKDENIGIPEDTLEEWIGSITSRYLVDKQYNNEWWKVTRFPLFTFLAGAAIAYSFLKLR
jgi:hypothetical protein